MNATKRGQRLHAWLAATEAAITKGAARPHVPTIPACWRSPLADALVEAERSTPPACACREGCSRCDGAELDAVMDVAQLRRGLDVRKAAILSRLASHARENAAWSDGKASGMTLLWSHCGHDAERVGGLIGAAREKAERLRQRAARLDARAGMLHV
jgi:hypothetical protein